LNEVFEKSHVERPRHRREFSIKSDFMDVSWKCYVTWGDFGTFFVRTVMKIQ